MFSKNQEDAICSVVECIATGLITNINWEAEDLSVWVSRKTAVDITDDLMLDLIDIVKTAMTHRLKGTSNERLH